MPLGTLERAPPPLFRQGPSALTRLALCIALALFLMVADVRLRILQPLRMLVATAIYPVQWLVLQPVQALRAAGGYFTTLDQALERTQDTQRRLAEQSVRAGESALLALENQRLRALLDLNARVPAPQRAAEVLYDAADPYSRKVVINKGQAQGIVAGSPVVDEAGVVGQVIRVYPMVSEVSLLTDRDQSIPVMNLRTGARYVAFGEPGFEGGGLELRFVAANADIQTGDALVTSGVDALYPAGLAVAVVAHVERRADSAFARIHCRPAARLAGVRHVMVIEPSAEQRPAPPPDPAPAKGRGKGAKP